MRASTAAAEQALDGLLSAADQNMVNAFTTGFRAAQAKLAISKVLTVENVAQSALESAQVTALAILVREQMAPDVFATIYRPFATIVPGPGAQPPAPPQRQVEVFVEMLKGLTGPIKDEVVAVGRALSEPQGKAVVPPAAGDAPTIPVPPAPLSTIEVASMYGNAWKATVAAAAQSGRTPLFRAAQTSAENAAPHDGSGMVATAGVAAGALVVEDLVPIETVLLLYEPFAGALPFENLR